MGQLFLDLLGKQGMLALWSCIITVQYFTGAAQGVDASRVVFAFAREKGVVVLEAFHYRFHPAAQRVRELVQQDHGDCEDVREMSLGGLPLEDLVPAQR